MRPILLATVLALAGCSTTSPQNTIAPTSTWQPTSSYTYTLQSSCGEQLLHGIMKITVQNGQTTAAVGLDESGKRTVEAAKLTSLPTLAALIRQYEEAVSRGAALANADYAPAGHPSRISIDYDKNALDDELCYVITDYTPA
ncbi:DUF6174 domain-containing protein [Catelliglobosispora koreensis]|uniref:DUF6174 domain-containing protein n=1 Tax=Catelliglobosispora koreensis TaxID=129052 RepID=UPI000363F58D|nr:DUF6174 domain-containing protein [Catelliglobosispora koreensis]